MRASIILGLGFLLSLMSLISWQGKQFFNLFAILWGGGQTISPLGRSSAGEAKPQVLGEITTLETTFDFGQVWPEKKVLAEGAYAYDLTNNKIIFEKDARLKLPAASTMKILTAAVALDRGKLEEEMTVNYFPTLVGESSMNLAFGEKFTLEELLYGLLLTSGNDAAETIALGLAGKREIFVDWMNEFAKKVGAQNTNLTTPSGLDEEGQYTTAYDLFLIGKHVFVNYPLLLKISSTREKFLAKTSNHRAYLIRNKLLLLDDFPFLGGKPGLGEQKKLSLVALLEKNPPVGGQAGRRILVSLIRTPSLRHDLEQIFKLL